MKKFVWRRNGGWRPLPGGEENESGQQGGTHCQSLHPGFLSESQVTMTDRPPESTAFRGSIKFRQNNLLIRREASSSAPTRFWSAATGRSDSSDPLRERPSTNLLPTPWALTHPAYSQDLPSPLRESDRREVLGVAYAPPWLRPEPYSTTQGSLRGELC